MKKIIILLLVFEVVFGNEKDSISNVNPFKIFKSFEKVDFCDVCGCSANGGSMGFSSILNGNFIGLRYYKQSYKSSDGLYSNSPWYQEDYNTFQIWSRVPVFKKTQFLLLIPYHLHSAEKAFGRQNISGLGDVTAIVMYEILNTKKDSANLNQKMFFGAGVKVPTGKYNELVTGVLNPSFQLGTGSWDYFFAAEYVIQKKKLGLNTMINYTIKTENTKNYRFGNQFNYGGILFYMMGNENISFVPQLGLTGEVYGSNYQYKQRLRDTEGTILFGKMGFEIGKDKISFGINAMLPTRQNLTGGNVKANYRWSVHLNYNL